MPRKIYYRRWCSVCNDYELFYYSLNSGKLVCSECKSEYNKTDLNEIPKEKIQEQRIRYKNSKRKQIRDTLNLMIDYSSNAFTDIFNNDWKPEIKEDDAGQKQIDKIKQRKREIENEKKLKQKQIDKQFILKYKGLRRNDLCICGSGKKYKHCCLPKVQKIKNNL